MNWNKLREEMEGNSYPPNQSFDPERLDGLSYSNKRMRTISKLFPELTFQDKFESLLDVGCNKGLFSFAFKRAFKNIIGIDPIEKMIDIANKIKTSYKLENIFFCKSSFENYNPEIKADVVHFGQCAHYLFRDSVRCKKHPLSFLIKAKELTTKYILIDGAFEGDPSVEFDANADNWSDTIKASATIEGYATILRPEFRLIKYGWSGDGATRFLAVFEKVL